MGFGMPVVASDCDLDPVHRGKCFNPFREICADAAWYFNPFDVENIAEAVQKVLADREYRQQLVARGYERVKQYRLDNTARTLAKLFEEVIN